MATKVLLVVGFEVVFFGLFPFGLFDCLRRVISPLQVASHVGKGDIETSHFVHFCPP